jgi:uncharacterized membrane protein (UPF0182 family)
VPIEQPRIYYGEGPDHYVVVASNSDEFDYASGDNEQARNRFDGGGGVRLSSLLRRVVYAWKFADTNLLISDALNDDSRLLYRRNISERVHQIAPFLRQSDPYPSSRRKLWMQDAYTYTDRSYSTRISGQPRPQQREGVTPTTAR